MTAGGYLKVNGAITVGGTGSVWTPGAGTVELTANNTLPATIFTSFNNLTVSGGTTTMGRALTINGDLTINSGTLVTANNGLTLNGNFSNSGTFTAGSSAITIGGTGTQSIDGFTTTGTVSMTKTGGTATFNGNVNGGALTLNGSGGTLNLGTGLTHTFTGTWTRTAGTLDGGSSTLNLGGTLSGTGGSFTSGTGTVNYNAAGAQTIAAVSYNNLIFSGSGAKSMPAGTSIAGNLSIAPSGSATASVGAGLNLPVDSLTLGGVLQSAGTYGGTTSSAGNVVPAYFAATTGILTVGTPAPWYSCAWKYRKKIVIDHTKVPNTDQANFPVLINLASDTALRDHALSSGNDLLFTALDGTTVLPYEREKYTSATGALVAWVKVSALSHTVDTVLYLYYGNSGAADQQNKTAVWDANFKLVYHLNDAGPTTALDSTANGNNGTQAGGVTFGSAGQMDGATTYTNGSTTPIEYISATAQPFGSSAYYGSYTYSLWIKVTGTVLAATMQGGDGSYFLDRIGSQEGNPLVSFKAATGNVWGYQTRYDDGTGLGGPVSATTIPGSTVWTHITMVRDYNTAFRLYVNGTQVATTTDTGSKALTPSTPKLARHASFTTGTDGLNGLLDEFRISSGVRSADWIATEYNNQSSPPTFYSLGTEQAITSISVETAANGTGTVVPVQNVASGSSITVYAIARDASATFLGNLAATWSLVNLTGSVVAGDLQASGDARSATFTGHLAGTAVIAADACSLIATNSGTITVLQGVGDFRTITNGNWNSLTNWERFNGTVWQPGFYPTNENAGTVTIRTGHTVTVTTVTTNDQVVVQSGGQLTVNNGVTLMLNNGAGNDLEINSGGTLTVLGTGVVGGAGSLILDSGANLGIGSPAGISSSGLSGSITNSGPRSFSTNANYTYLGTSAQVTGNGLPGTVNNLTIANAAGVTFAGTLTVNGVGTVNAGSLFNATGTINGPVTLNGTIAPGTNVVSLNTGSETWNGGGTYQWQIKDATNTAGAGTGWDLLNTTGTLTINATAGSKFTINLATLAPSSGLPGNATNFDKTKTMGWIIAQASGGITGFDPSYFTLNTSGFLNPLSPTGGFTINKGTTATNEYLYLLYNPTAPTAVVLYRFDLVVQNGGVVVQWSTASEVDTVGFEVYRQTAEDTWMLVGPPGETFVLAQGLLTGGIGADYALPDPQAVPGTTYTYQLMEYTTDGGRQEYGPFVRMASELRLTQPVWRAREGMVLKWLSRDNESYSVLRAPSPLGPFEPVVTGLRATPPENRFTDPGPLPWPCAFYKIVRD